MLGGEAGKSGVGGVEFLVENTTITASPDCAEPSLTSPKQIVKRSDSTY
jgi:hypothetical protein